MSFFSFDFMGENNGCAGWLAALAALITTGIGIHHYLTDRKVDTYIPSSKPKIVKTVRSEPLEKSVKETIDTRSDYEILLDFVNKDHRELNKFWDYYFSEHSWRRQESEKREWESLVMPYKKRLTEIDVGLFDKIGKIPKKSSGLDYFAEIEKLRMESLVDKIVVYDEFFFSLQSRKRLEENKAYIWRLKRRKLIEDILKKYD